MCVNPADIASTPHNWSCTCRGWAQADAVNKHLKKEGPPIDLIVSSPLTRTLETAAGCFGGLYHSESIGSKPSGHASAFMESTASLEGKRTTRSSVPMPGVPVVAHELCRETIGVRRCFYYDLDKQQRRALHADWHLMDSTDAHSIDSICRYRKH